MRRDEPARPGEEPAPALGELGEQQAHHACSRAATKVAAAFLQNVAAGDVCAYAAHAAAERASEAREQEELLAADWEVAAEELRGQ